MSEPTTASTFTLRAYRPWLHRYAWLVVIATFLLVALGGTVTSKGVGLAVPDWPTTFDYNMFLFPPAKWTGGIFWEHTHRLKGALVGTLTIGLTLWLWFTQRSRNWLRIFGIGLLILVILQGIMGGLRVSEVSITWAIVHGITGQLFFACTVLVACVTSSHWLTPQHAAVPWPRAWWVLGIALLMSLVLQLALGAIMRHTHSGLAIPDFPTHYGQLIPPFTYDTIHDRLAEILPYDAPQYDYQPWQVAIHFSHRMWAIVVCLLAALLIVSILRHRTQSPATRSLRWLACVLALLLVVQISLGASVIWSTRHPEVATAHQSLGAILLATTLVMLLRIWHGRMAVHNAKREMRNAK